MIEKIKNISKIHFDTAIFILFIIGLFLTHTKMSYVLILPVYAIILAKIILIDKKLIVSRDYFIITMIFLVNIIVQLYFNFSKTTIFYSIVLLFSIYVYAYIHLLELNKKYIAWFVMALLIIILAHPSLFSSGQFASYFGNANSLAAAYLVLFFILEILGDYKYRLINWFVFMPVYIILIESRGVLLAIIVYFISLIMSSFKLRNITFLGIIFMLYTMFMLYVHPDNQTLTTALSSLGLENMQVFGSSITYGAHRDKLWQIAALHNPSTWFGVGFGKSNDYINSFIHHDLSPHNSLLKIYLEGGFVFLFSYFALFIYIYRKAKSNVTKSFLIAIQVRMFFESAFPFGISLGSAILILPYFIENALRGFGKEKFILSKKLLKR